MATLLALKRLIGNELGRAAGTCSAAGTTTTILDTTADSPLDTEDSQKLYVNAWAMIEADSAGTPLNVGEVRRVKTYVPGSQTLTTSAAYSNATTTTQSYGVYMRVPPTRVGVYRGIDDYINDILRELRYRTLSLLTLVTDGDCETSGVTNWTASNSTLTKSTSTGVTVGDQALRVLNSSANGYARSALVSVVENQTYRVVADVRVATGTATLILYDETNGANIDTATTSEIKQGYLCLDNCYIPSSCKQVSVRLRGTGASDDAYWDNVSLRNANAREMDLPSWVTRPNQIEEIYYVRGGNQENDNDLYFTDERRWYRVHRWEIIEDYTGATAYKIQFSDSIPFDAHLFVQGIRPYAELSADTDSTDANSDMLKAWALARIYADLNEKEQAARWIREAQRLQRAYVPRWSGRMLMPLRDL